MEHPSFSGNQKSPSGDPKPQPAVENLDWRAVRAAAQALCIETEPEALIDALMRIALEHAGAERGILVLLQDGEPRIAAIATISSGRVLVTQDDLKPIGEHLLEEAVQYVLRFNARLIVDDASKSVLLAQVGCSGQVPSKSVSCLPILKHAQLIGVLYLENNLLLKVSTPGLATILEFLAAHTVISLEIAQLYADLRCSEAFLAEGQKLGSKGSWSRNLQTRKLLWSEQNHQIFDRDPAEGSPPEYKDFVAIHPEDLAEWRRVIEPAVANRHRFSHQFRIVAADGSIKHIHTTDRPIHDEVGSLREYIGTSTSITERKRREDAFRDAEPELTHFTRLMAMGELAASIAHEINQPLTSILTNAETSLLLLDRPTPDVELARDAIKRVIRDGRHTSDVIRIIRSMLRKSKPDVARIEINDLIQDVIDLARGELRQNAVALETSLASNLPVVLGDRVQLRQVVINLVQNAIESMVDVTRRPKILRLRTATTGDGIEVAVADTGIGLDATTSTRIFEPFYTTKPLGMGMGLSICRSIVESHNGHLHAISLAPVGSLFRFTLPAAT